jgi:hypothetical protein
MSRPSTPDASFARFSPSFGLARAAAASATFCADRGRHDHDAVVVGQHDVAGSTLIRRRRPGC